MRSRDNDGFEDELTAEEELQELPGFYVVSIREILTEEDMTFLSDFQKRFKGEVEPCSSQE